MDEFIPNAILPARKNRPWLSKQIIQAVRHRNALFRRAKSTADSVHFAAYKSARNKVVKLIQAAKKFLLEY